ncbi:hypothetical protein G6F35_016179 [Rhizopus arrhizus]|nr:hypothetical protein G6F35_016179 [Rhizopus arrhizus]
MPGQRGQRPWGKGGRPALDGRRQGHPAHAAAGGPGPLERAAHRLEPAGPVEAPAAGRAAGTRLGDAGHSDGRRPRPRRGGQPRRLAVAAGHPRGADDPGRLAAPGRDPAASACARLERLGLRRAGRAGGARPASSTWSAALAEAAGWGPGFCRAQRGGRVGGIGDIRRR